MNITVSVGVSNSRFKSFSELEAYAKHLSGQSPRGKWAAQQPILMERKLPVSTSQGKLPEPEEKC